TRTPPGGAIILFRRGENVNDFLGCEGLLLFLPKGISFHYSASAAFRPLSIFCVCGNACIIFTCRSGRLVGRPLPFRPLICPIPADVSQLALRACGVGRPAHNRGFVRHCLAHGDFALAAGTALSAGVATGAQSARGSWLGRTQDLILPIAMITSVLVIMV